MADLPDAAINMFSNAACEKEKPFSWVSTVDKDGSPHVVPACFVKPLDKNKLAISINFATKTAENIKQRKKVAVGVAVPYDGFMIKGSGEITTSGPVFQDVSERVTKRFGGKIKAQAALVVNVEKVYSLKPAPGKKRLA